MTNLPEHAAVVTADSVQPRYLPTRLAANYLGVGRSTFHELRRRHDEFPRGIQIGKRSLLFDRLELDAWMAAQQRVHRADEPEGLRNARLSSR